MIQTAAAMWNPIRLSVAGGSRATIENELRTHVAESADQSLQLFHFILDAQDTVTAIEFEQTDFEGLRRRVQAPAGQSNYWITGIEPGAGMLVAAGEPADNDCIADFRGKLHHRGDDCVGTLRTNRALEGQATQLQLLNGAARLGHELLS